jgi:hypothetical protein
MSVWSNILGSIFPMTDKKLNPVFTVKFLDTDSDQVILADYLKSTNDAKGQVLTATKAHFYAIALSEDPNSSDEEIELAILESLQLLWGQMNYIVDYHRIKRKIQLSPQSLMRFGLGQIALESIESPPQPQPLVPMMPPEQEESVAIVEAGKDRQSTSNASNEEDDDDILKDFCGDSDSLNLDL